MRTDWQKIESDYMAGSLSYAAIAQKYGVSPRQVAEHGRKNDWPRKRQEYRSKVATRAAQKSIYKKSERVAQRLAEVDEAAGLLLAQMLDALRNDPDMLHRHHKARGETRLEMLNGENAQSLARTLETLAAVIRDANDKPGKVEAAKIRDMQQRLKLEKKKQESAGKAEPVEVLIGTLDDTDAGGMDG